MSTLKTVIDSGAADAAPEFFLAFKQTGSQPDAGITESGSYAHEKWMIPVYSMNLASLPSIEIN